MSDLTTRTDATRTYRLEGTYNFRDIGGYRTTDGRTVRWGQVYRSDALHRLTDADLAELRPLGVRTLLDLRSGREIAESGRGLLHAEPGLEVVHIPFGRIGEEADPTWSNLTLAELYRGIVIEARDALATVMTTVAERGDAPLVIHCAAGKDRTGVSVALLLRLLGVDDDTIVADYLLTGSNFEIFRRTAPADVRAQLDAFPDEIMRVDEQVMRETLALIDAESGSTEAFLAAAGVTPQTVAALRERLLATD